eukprot:scaffold15585_cov107-Isochrysis_galbana.AAC.1
MRPRVLSRWRHGRSCPAHVGPSVRDTPAHSPPSMSGQSPHRGSTTKQRCCPNPTSSGLSSAQSWRGSHAWTRRRAASADLTGPDGPVQPSRLQIRSAWVSTAMPSARPHTACSTRWAAFGPTPGSFCSSSSAAGTRPWCLCRSTAQVPRMYRALLGGYAMATGPPVSAAIKRVSSSTSTVSRHTGPSSATRSRSRCIASATATSLERAARMSASTVWNRYASSPSAARPRVWQPRKSTGASRPARACSIAPSCSRQRGGTPAGEGRAAAPTGLEGDGWVGAGAVGSGAAGGRGGSAHSMGGWPLLAR